MTIKSDLNQQREDYKLLLEKSLQEAVGRLSLLGSVRSISVFGSFARGRRDLFTDLDLLVVMDTDMGLVDRLGFLYSLVALPVDVDILCYTPEEFGVLKSEGWLERALQDAQVLYENRPL